jgi:putative phosphoribosyl transferase
MPFLDRHDAGKNLVLPLKAYKDHKDTLVFGLPRGGVVVAYEIALGLNLPLHVLCPVKIGAPFNPEYAIGAATEYGEAIFNEEIVHSLGISKNTLNEMAEQAKKLARERSYEFQKKSPSLKLFGKTAIVIDDGIATGLTLRASILALKKLGAAKIIVAVPVAPRESLKEIQTLCDEVICLEIPTQFHAVGEFYTDFSQTSSEEVVRLLKQAKQNSFGDSHEI